MNDPQPNGTCSACGGTAFQAPSGRWWHVNTLACPNVSWTLWRPVVVEDGVMRSTTPAELPATFVPNGPIT